MSKYFLRYLNIKKHRVQTVLKKHFETGEYPTENRGGDHRSQVHRKKEWR